MNISEGNIDDGYRPKLFINLKTVSDKKLQDEFYKEIKAGSITPRTFKSRAFDTKDSEWFIDTYSFEDNKILRYGIDINKITSEMIKKENIKCIDAKSHSSVNSRKYTPEDAAEVLHFSLERQVTRKAIKYLLEGKSQVVMVDILARDNNAIKILENGSPEIHSVVLYKNPVVGKKNEIVVIDPSNFLFSSHLSNLNKDEQLQKLSFFGQIITYHKGIQIYKPGKEGTGQDKEEYRDCIDAGAKISNTLSELKNTIISFNAKDNNFILKLDAIKMISNISKIDETIAKNGGAIKIKQSSNLKIVKLFYWLEEQIKKLQILVESCDKKWHNKFEIQHVKILKEFGYDNLIIVKLSSFYNYHSDKLMNHLEKSKVVMNSLIQEFQQDQKEVIGGINYETLEEL